MCEFQIVTFFYATFSSYTVILYDRSSETCLYIIVFHMINDYNLFPISIDALVDN